MLQSVRQFVGLEMNSEELKSYWEIITEAKMGSLPAMSGMDFPDNQWILLLAKNNWSIAQLNNDYTDHKEHPLFKPQMLQHCDPSIQFTCQNQSCGCRPPPSTDSVCFMSCAHIVCRNCWRAVINQHIQNGTLPMCPGGCNIQISSKVVNIVASDLYESYIACLIRYWTASRAGEDHVSRLNKMKQ